MSGIHYGGASEGAVKTALIAFQPLDDVFSLSAKSIPIKDSLKWVRNGQPLTSREDSLIFSPPETKAYQAILSYKKRVEEGIPAQRICPKLIQLKRLLLPEDSSFEILPKVEVSKFLAEGNFLFLGGSPFIKSLNGDSLYKDAGGNPEKRFSANITENTSFILSSLCHFGGLRGAISFGPPLWNNNDVPKEVRGIGSIRHELSNRIPVFLLTEKGGVPGYMISLAIQLVPNYQGCESDQPVITFAYSSKTEINDILGVYIPFHLEPSQSWNLTRHSHSLWTADANGDGIPEVACISRTFEGMASGSVLAEALWFVNVNGSWVVIDWGRELDCT